MNETGIALGKFVQQVRSFVVFVVLLVVMLYLQIKVLTDTTNYRVSNGCKLEEHFPSATPISCGESFYSFSVNDIFLCFLSRLNRRLSQLAQV